MSSSARKNILNWPTGTPKSNSTKQAINLIPNPSQRLLVVGSTGSGKTTFTVGLLKKLHGKRPLAILDTKGDDSLILPGSYLVERAKECLKWDPQRQPTLVYRPVAGELLDYALLDGFLDWIYTTGGALCYVDELSSLGQRYVQRPGLTNLLSRGRARNRNGRVISSPVWMSTQRPRGIPMSAITESDRIVAFHLNHAADRKIISEDTCEGMLNPPGLKYGFQFFERGMSSSIEFSPLKIR